MGTRHKLVICNIAIIDDVVASKLYDLALMICSNDLNIFIFRVVYFEMILSELDFFTVRNYLSKLNRKFGWVDLRW